MSSKDTYNPVGNLQGHHVKTKYFIIVALLLVIFFGVVAFFSIQSEKKHHQIKFMYANAFIPFSKINLETEYKPEVDDENIHQAIKSLETIIKKNTTYIEHFYALYNISLLKIYQNKSSDSIKYLQLFDKADESNILTTKAFLLLAQIYENTKDYNKAIEVYNSLSEKKGELQNLALYHLALIYTKQNKIDMAISMYKKIPVKTKLGTIANRNITVLNTLREKIQ